MMPVELRFITTKRSRLFTERRPDVSGYKTAIVSLMVMCGCSESDTTSQSSSNNVEMTSADVNRETGFMPAGRADVEALTHQIQTAIAELKSDTFRSLIDGDAALDRVFVGLDVSAEFRTGFQRGMESQGGFGAVVDQIIQVCENGGTYQLVRYVEDGNEIRPLFRLSLGPGEGVNYHELTIARTGGGQTRIVDLFVYLSGENLTQTLRRMALPAIVASNRSFLEQLSGADAEYATNADKILEIAQAAQQGMSDRVLELCESAPSVIRDDKSVLMIRLAAAQQVSDEAYRICIEDIERLFPDDPGNDFRAIDRLVVEGKFDQVIERVDRMIAQIQDPYLNLLKVDALMELGRMDDAKEAAELAMAAVPDSPDPRWTLIGYSLHVGDHAAVARLLTELSERFGFEFGELESIPEYADFVASDAYREWKRQQPATP
jgi:hypothetical protein